MPFGGRPYDGPTIDRRRFESNGEAYYPSSDSGIPVKQKGATHLKGDEIDELPCEVKFQSRMFCMWKQEDKSAFDEVMDRFCSQAGVVISRRRDEWIADEKHMMIWLEWADVCRVVPK